MKVVIEVSQFYDWIPLTTEDQTAIDAASAEYEEMLGVLNEGELAPDFVPPFPCKETDTGIRKRVVINQETYTEIVIPPPQLQVAINARDVPAQNVKEAVLWFVQMHMPHNAPREAWTKIHCESNPDVQKFLRRFFDIGDE